MFRLISCFSVLLLTILPGCGKAGSLAANYQDKTTYFTHGSPLALLSGASFYTDGLLPSADVLLYNNFHLMNTGVFVEKSRLSTAATVAQIEAENRTDGGSNDVRQVALYQFSKDGDGRMLWHAPASKISPVFGFDASGDELKLVDINGQAVEVVHYSLKNDQMAFSILVKHRQNNSGVVLTSYVFGSVQELSNPVYTTGDYQFLNGSERNTWDSLPAVHYCGTGSAAVTDSIRKSVEAWGADPLGGSERLPLPFKVSAIYPPFSDLNFHCIYIVPSFNESSSPTAKVLGVTLPSINLASRHIIDSDIFLFSDFLNNELASGEPSPVTMHELGHFWGLGHDFRVNADGSARHESIMGYSKGTNTISPWDFEAIRDLYNAALVITP